MSNNLKLSIFDLNIDDEIDLQNKVLLHESINLVHNNLIKFNYNTFVDFVEEFCYSDKNHFETEDDFLKDNFFKSSYKTSDFLYDFFINDYLDYKYMSLYESIFELIETVEGQFVVVIKSDFFYGRERSLFKEYYLTFKEYVKVSYDVSSFEYFNLFIN